MGRSDLSRAHDFVSTLENVLGKSLLDLHAPHFDSSDLESLGEVLASGYISTASSYTGQFEMELSIQTGIRNVVAVNSGTSALFLALRAVGVRDEDLVLTPCLTFVATPNAVSYCGAEPVFVDIEPESLGMDPDSLRNWLERYAQVTPDGVFRRGSGRRISAIIVVHCFGLAARIEEIQRVAQSYGIAVVEDAAEALGTSINGRSVGRFGNVGIFSFNGNKLITTGGGGAVVTEDVEVADRVRHLSTTARIPGELRDDHDEVGFNMRMPGINAALGLSQIRKLQLYVQAKREAIRAYELLLEPLECGTLIRERAHSLSNYWLATFIFDPGDEELCHRVIEIAQRRGLGLRAPWRLLPDSRPYRLCESTDLSRARSVERRLLNLPSGYVTSKLLAANCLLSG